MGAVNIAKEVEIQESAGVAELEELWGEERGGEGERGLTVQCISMCRGRGNKGAELT